MHESRCEFVLKLPSVDTLSTHSGTGRITSLDHKIPNHPMKNNPIIIALLRKSDEIGTGFRCLLHKELHFDDSLIRFDSGDSIACFWGVELRHGIDK